MTEGREAILTARDIEMGETEAEGTSAVKLQWEFLVLSTKLLITGWGGKELWTDIPHGGEAQRRGQTEGGTGENQTDRPRRNPKSQREACSPLMLGRLYTLQSHHQPWFKNLSYFCIFILTGWKQHRALDSFMTALVEGTVLIVPWLLNTARVPTLSPVTTVGLRA